MGKGFKRVNLELTPKDEQRVEVLKAKTSAKKTAHVIRDALFVYEAIVKHLSAGDQFLRRDQYNSITEVQFMIDVSPEISPPEGVEGQNIASIDSQRGHIKKATSNSEVAEIPA
jgi:hypothetical protein